MIPLNHSTFRTIATHSIGAVGVAIMYRLAMSPMHVWWLGIGLLALLSRAVALAPKLPFRNVFWYWWAAMAGSIYWIEYPVSAYGGLPRPISGLPWLLLSAYASIYGATAAWMSNRVSQRPWLRVTVFAFVLAGAELLRERYFLNGFSWSEIGYVVAGIPSLLQVADLVGVHGITVLLVLIAGLPWIKQGREPRAWAASIGLLIISVGYGEWRLDDVNAQVTGSPKSVVIGTVQGNIDQAEKWQKSMRDNTIETYVNATEALTTTAEIRPELLIWPETAMPFWFQRPSISRERVIDVARRSGAYLLTGVPAYVRTPNGPSSRNRAVVISPRGHVEGQVDKKHLVPFGEYMPMKPILGFIEKMVVGVGDFTPGEGSSIVKLPLLNVEIGISICYEILFANETRLRIGGSDIIAVISNDAWFGPTDGPFQQADMARFRAVENRVPIVRSANSGVSAWIGADGIMHEATELFVADSFTATIPVVSIDTLYGSWGGVLEALLMLTILPAAIFAWRNREIS